VLHVPPLLQLRPGSIEWSLGDGKGGWWRDGWRADGAQYPDPLPSTRLSCLNQFIRLAEEPDERRFLLFAQRYGVLGLCRVPEGARINGVCLGHPAAPEYWYPGVRDKGVPQRVDPSLSTSGQWYWEPIEGWRQLARQARLILDWAFCLRSSEGWSRLPFDAARAQYSTDDAESSLHSILESLAGSWLDNAGITVNFTWSPGEQARLVLSTGGIRGPSSRTPSSGIVTDPLVQLGWPLHNLFGTLALQLVGALCADERLVQCARSRCGTIFMHEGVHRPRRDQPYYCGEACRHEARKEDKREWAAKNRAAKKAAAVTSDSHPDSQDD